MGQWGDGEGEEEVGEVGRGVGEGVGDEVGVELLDLVHGAAFLEQRRQPCRAADGGAGGSGCRGCGGEGYGGEGGLYGSLAGNLNVFWMRILLVNFFI